MNIILVNRIKKHLIFRHYQKEWRKRNRHNATSIQNVFPLDIVSVGKSTYGSLHINCYLIGTSCHVSIGNYVSIAKDVEFFLNENHQTHTITTFPLSSFLQKQQNPADAVSKGDIIVEDEVWIGAGAKILSGVRIGKGSIIGTGAVVSKDIPPYSIAIGNPIRILKKRFPDEIIEIIQDINLTDIPSSQLMSMMPLLYEKIDSPEKASEIREAFMTAKKSIQKQP